MLPTKWPLKPQAADDYSSTRTRNGVDVLASELICPVEMQDRSSGPQTEQLYGCQTTAGIFSRHCTEVCAVPAWIIAGPCLPSHSLICHNSGYWGTKLAVKSLFQFWKCPWNEGHLFQVANSWRSSLSFQCLLVFVCVCLCCMGEVQLGLWDLSVVQKVWKTFLQNLSNKWEDILFWDTQTEESNSD